MRRCRLQRCHATLQAASLKQGGYDPGPIDGILGPKTLAALQRYIEAQERDLANTSSTRASEADDS